MGSCSSLIRPNSEISFDNNRYTYPRNCSVLARKSSFEVEKIIFDFSLPEPIQLKSEQVLVPKFKFSLSECVLPGIDPKGTFLKSCQDSVLTLFTGTTLFACLFDGHGVQGDRVANFCNCYSQKYFSENWHEENPQNFLRDLVENCNRDLCEFKGNVDASISGR